jgi:uncharacterized membrane protein
VRSVLQQQISYHLKQDGEGMLKLITVFFISMVPVIELRGAIPVGVAAGCDPWITMLVAIVGNLMPIPFILLFIRKIFHWMRQKSPRLNAVVDRMEAKAEAKKDKVLKYEKFGLFLFVAIPLPGTGAWTGALIAAMLDMSLKSAFPSIILGVCSAGLVITMLMLGIISI